MLSTLPNFEGFNETETRIMREALDLYVRVHMGRMDHVVDMALL
jgi:hypothetical protein